MRMFKPLECAIGLRYTRVQGRNQFISIISLISILGIAIGVWALITVLTVMNGFQEELRARLLSVTSHISIYPADGQPLDFKALDQLIKHVTYDGQVLASAPFANAHGLLSHEGQNQGIVIRGVDIQREIQVSDYLGDLTGAQIDAVQAGRFRLIIGVKLAKKLGIDVGDRVLLTLALNRMTAAGMVPRIRRFEIAGVYDSGVSQFDGSLVLMDYRDLSVLSDRAEQVDGVRLRLSNPVAAPQLAIDVAESLGEEYRVRSWVDENLNFFRALKVERRVMSVILFLIICVAVFNILSALVMVVVDKRADIGILQTLGMSPGRVMAVFMIQGTLLGALGTVLGTIMGVLTGANIDVIVPAIESLLGFSLFPGDLYQISSFPGKLLWQDVVNISMLSFLLSVVSTLYPSLSASRIQPAEALRYE